MDLAGKVKECPKRFYRYIKSETVAMERVGCLRISTVIFAWSHKRWGDM